MTKNSRKNKDIGSGRCKLFVWLVLSLGSLCFHTIVWAGNSVTDLEIEPTTVEKTGENLAIRVEVRSYSLRLQKLGDDAPDGSIFLIIRGSLINKSAGKQTSVPDVQDAFFLRLKDELIVVLHPISEDTADPFWGPILLEPGEELPVEMVFAVPAQPLDQANLMHISNMGAINLYVIGEARTLPSTHLAGPVRKGQAEIAVERVDFDSFLSGWDPPKGERYVRVYYWFTNLRPLQPFETDLAGLTVLVEDGYYVYPPVSESRSRDLPPQGETFYAQEPTPGEMVFLVPEKTGDLALVHFTEEGPLSLDLTPNIGALEPQSPVAGPVGKRSISMSLFQPQHAVKLGPPKAGLRYVVLDVGLRLNFDNPSAHFAFEPTKSFELHDGRGQFYKPEKVDSLLRRPLGPSDLWRDQLTRGEVAFLVPAGASSFTLVIPFKAGPTRLPVPETLLSLPTTTTALKRLPTSSPLPGVVEVNEPEQPETKAKETAKSEPSSKRTIEEELVSRGYKDLIVVVRDDGVAVVIGVVRNDKDIDDVSSLVSSFKEVKEIQIHVSTVPTLQLHPQELKKLAESAMKAVGLTGVQLRMRKKDELILLGTVADDEEEEMALSVARILVKDVVNLLKKPAVEKR